MAEYDEISRELSDIFLMGAINQAALKMSNIFGAPVEEIAKYGHSTWKNNGVDYDFSCQAYMTIESRTHVYYELKTVGKTDLNLRIDWYDGKIESLRCSCSVPMEHIASNAQLKENSFGFDRSQVTYEGGKMGFSINISGRYGDVWLLKDLSCLYSLFSYSEREDLNGSTIANNSVSCSSDDNHIQVHDIEDNITDISVSDLKKARFYLFGKMYQDERSIAARDFVIDCIASQVPGLREIIEELNEYPASVAKAAYANSGLPSLEICGIDSLLSTVEIPAFDNRQPNGTRGK